MDTAELDAITRRIDEVVAQSPFPEDLFHSLNTVEWVLKLDPAADAALQIAALGHDIERGLPERMVHAADFESFDAFKDAHAKNSADILAEILREADADDDLIRQVYDLVILHETGGEGAAEILKNADVLSFFHVSLPLYFDRRGTDITRKRCVWGYKKLPDDLKYLVHDIEFLDEELQHLVLDTIGPEPI